MNTLARIQAELSVPKNQRNNFGNYNYRSCEDILEAIKPLLQGGTLTISDEIVCIGNNNPAYFGMLPDAKGNQIPMYAGEQRFYVKATVTLRGYYREDDEEKKNFPSVEWHATAYARESFEKKGMDASQITGAASSYARKYALNGLFCIDDAKDSDATNMHDKEAAEMESVNKFNKGVGF